MWAGRSFQWMIMRGKNVDVIVFQSRDLSICKRMSSCRRTGVPDQVVSSRYRNKVICAYIGGPAGCRCVVGQGCAI